MNKEMLITKISAVTDYDLVNIISLENLNDLNTFKNSRPIFKCTCGNQFSLMCSCHLKIGLAKPSSAEKALNFPDFSLWKEVCVAPCFKLWWVGPRYSFSLNNATILQLLSVSFVYKLATTVHGINDKQKGLIRSFAASQRNPSKRFRVIPSQPRTIWNTGTQGEF